jgi:hypothetical protein
MARRWVTGAVVLAALLPLGLVPSSSAAERINCRITVRTISEGDELRIVYTLRGPARHREYLVRFFVDGDRVWQDRAETNRAGRIRVVAFVEDPPGRTAVRAAGRDSVTRVVCAADVVVPER